jgi:hypothetical protein
VVESILSGCGVFVELVVSGWFTFTSGSECGGNAHTGAERGKRSDVLSIG